MQLFAVFPEETNSFTLARCLMLPDVSVLIHSAYMGGADGRSARVKQREM
jgi:hypothetical protein